MDTQKKNPARLSKAQQAELEKIRRADISKQIETMSGLGFSHMEIAQVVGIPRLRIEREFTEELKRGRSMADMAVMQNLYKIATGETAQAASAAIFWTKVRRRWHEVQRIIHGLDPEIMIQFVKHVSTVIKKNVPDICPHCRTHLELRPKIAEQIRALSARLTEALPAPEIVQVVDRTEDQG